MSQHCIHGHGNLMSRCPICEREAEEFYADQARKGVGSDTAWPWHRLSTFVKDYWRARIDRWNESRRLHGSKEKT